MSIARQYHPGVGITYVRGHGLILTAANSACCCSSPCENCLSGTPATLYAGLSGLTWTTCYNVGDGTSKGLNIRGRTFNGSYCLRQVPGSPCVWEHSEYWPCVGWDTWSGENCTGVITETAAAAALCGSSNFVVRATRWDTNEWRLEVFLDAYLLFYQSVVDPEGQDGCGYARTALNSYTEEDRGSDIYGWGGQLSIAATGCGSTNAYESCPSGGYLPSDDALHHAVPCCDCTPAIMVATMAGVELYDEGDCQAIVGGGSFSIHDENMTGNYRLARQTSVWGQWGYNYEDYTTLTTGHIPPVDGIGYVNADCTGATIPPSYWRTTINLDHVCDKWTIRVEATISGVSGGINWSYGNYVFYGEAEGSADCSDFSDTEVPGSLVFQNWYGDDTKDPYFHADKFGINWFAMGGTLTITPQMSP